MKIVYLNSLYPPDVRGGAELVLRTQAETMVERGHDVTVLTIGAQRAPALLEQHVNGVRVLRYGFRNRYFHRAGVKPPAVERLRWHWRDRYNPRMAGDTTARLRALRPDVVCCHNVAGWSIAIWRTLRALGLPSVQVLHDQYLLCGNCMMFRDGHNCATQCAPCALLRSRHAHASRALDAVVGVSRYVLERLLAAGFFAQVPVRDVLHNAVRPLTALTNRAVRAANAPLRVGFIGTLAPCKGIEPLLRAVVDSDLPLRLLVAGRGEPEYEHALRTRYRDARIEFLGYVPSRDLFGRVDVTVVPSLWNDTLPSVVFESLGHGLPVVAARRGGIPEMVRAEYNGLLFEPAEPGALRASLERLIGSPALLRTLAANCVPSAAAFFDLSAWATRHEAILSAAIEAAQRHRTATTDSGVARRRELTAKVVSCEG